MKMDAIKRQVARTDLTSPNISAKFRSGDEIGQEAGVSGDTIRNYISLTQLVPELQQMVDEKKIALTPAYQLAALTPKEQALLLETIDSEQATPSLSQAQRMKKLSQSGELNEDTMLSIMMEQKKPEVWNLTIPMDKFCEILIALEQAAMSFDMEYDDRQKAMSTELSKAARKEWYLRHKDKGVEP